MLITTIYNQANAVITGCYFTAKGDRIDVEYMGSALECECYVNAVRQDNDGCNEVHHVVNRVETLWFNVPHQSNLLFTVWNNPIASQGY